MCRKTLPSGIGELNVHFGVFIGGLGDFSETYLSSVDNFRGCMADVISQTFFFFPFHFVCKIENVFLAISFVMGTIFSFFAFI